MNGQEAFCILHNSNLNRALQKGSTTMWAIDEQ
jgi:hypothetical protein